MEEVDVNFRVVGTSPFEFVYHIIVHLVRLNASIIKPAFVFSLYWYQSVGQTFALEIFLKSHCIVIVTGDKIDRSFPVVMGKDINNNELILKEPRSFKFYFDIRNYFVGIFGADSTVCKHSGFVNRDTYCAGRYIIEFLVKILKFGCVAAAVNKVYDFLGSSRFLGTFINSHLVIYPVVVQFYRKSYRQRVGLVCFSLHLVDIPVGVEQHKIADSHVSPYTFNLLVVPERESIVIAVGEQNSVLFGRVEVVCCNIAGKISARTIVVVPVLLRHYRRHGN